MADGRRDVRHSVHLTVKLKSGNDPESLFTEDVSYRGLFIRTDTPRSLRTLVLLDVNGPNGEVIELCGMVVHVIEPNAQRTPGMGVQLYGLSKEARQRWTALVDYVAGEYTPRLVRGKAVDADEHIRRQYPRVPAVLRVEVPSMQELTSLYTRNISKGGMFVETDLTIDVGQPLAMEIVHPRIDATFAVEAVVRRVVKERGRSGVGVEFVGLSDEQREQFWEFVGLDLSELETEIAPNDPALE